MPHWLSWLLRFGRSDEERAALLGDLEEAYRSRVSRGDSRLAVSAWYAKEVVHAFACAMWDARPHGSLGTAIFADVNYTMRRWRRRPGFAAAAMLTLALGIGSATSLFSVVDAVLLKPLPWVKPDSLVVIHGVYPERRNNPATAPTWNRWYLSYPAWDALKASPAFEAVAAWSPNAQTIKTIGDERSELAHAFEVSANFLPTLGVPLELGRFFDESDDNARGDARLILTHEFWQSRFGGRKDVIGSRVLLVGPQLWGEQYGIISGVIGPGFQFDGRHPDLFRNLSGARELMRSRPSPSVRLVGRLAPGVSFSSADSQAVAAVMAAPNDTPGSARLVPIEDEQLGSTRRPLWLLFGGAGVLLLIACSNVAGLLLGEARVRRHEFAVRAALGGSRLRVFRQLLIEHGLLALAGSAVGLAVAYWMTDALIAIAPAGLPRIDEVSVNLRVTIFAVAAGLATSFVFGITPAVALIRTHVAGVLAEGGRDGGVTRLLGQRLVVVAQLSLALVLLTGATLFGETMLRLHALPLGFNPDGVAVVSTEFTGEQYGDAATIAAAWKAAGPKSNPSTVLYPLFVATTTTRTRAVIDRLGAIPGVVRVAGSSAVPFVANPRRDQIVLPGHPDSERYDALQQAITSQYFAAMRMNVLSGRGFDASNAGGERVAVVSAEFERRFFPGGAVNQTFSTPQYQSPNSYRIIGVVSDVKRLELTDDDRPAFYINVERFGAPEDFHFLIRTAGDPAALLPAVRQALKQVSPQLVVTSLSTMTSRVGQSVVEERFRAMLSAMFGGAALILAAVGLYGLAARRVADRRREFGVRVALGARPADVRRLVLRDALVIVSIGLGAGVPCAIATAQVARGLLFGVTETSLHVFAGSALLLVIAVMAAAIVPARRAARVDPIVVLRH